MSSSRSFMRFRRRLRKGQSSPPACCRTKSTRRDLPSFRLPPRKRPRRRHRQPDVASTPDPIELAARALRHRERSRQEIDDRLTRAGVDQVARADALETLERVGYVDDTRFALARAEALAGRGFGDAAIRADLEQHGLAAGAIADALAGLVPESARALALVERLGRTPTVAGRLVRKGFAEDSLERALGAEFLGYDS